MWPQISCFSISWELFGNTSPNPVLNQKLWRWGSAVCCNKPSGWVLMLSFGEPLLVLSSWQALLKAVWCPLCWFQIYQTTTDCNLGTHTILRGCVTSLYEPISECKFIRWVLHINFLWACRANASSWEWPILGFRESPISETETEAQTLIQEGFTKVDVMEWGCPAAAIPSRPSLGLLFPVLQPRGKNYRSAKNSWERPCLWIMGTSEMFPRLISWTAV